MNIVIVNVIIISNNLTDMIGYLGTFLTKIYTGINILQFWTGLIYNKK